MSVHVDLMMSGQMLVKLRWEVVGVMIFECIEINIFQTAFHNAMYGTSICMGFQMTVHALLAVVLFNPLLTKVAHYLLISFFLSSHSFSKAFSMVDFSMLLFVMVVQIVL